MEPERIYFRVAGRFSVTSDVSEVVSLLGSCAEPVPAMPVVAILAGEPASLPPGATVFRYPSQASLASGLIGIELPAQGSEGEPETIAGRESEPEWSITATQLRLWLFRNGIGEAQVLEAIAAIPDETLRGEAAIQWAHIPYFERSHPLVQAVAGLLGVNVDEAFSEASRL
jgi:hypothetical protein